MEHDGDEEPPLAISIDDVVDNKTQPILRVEQDDDNQLPDLPEAQPVGVTVITGYLGAGKSTVR